MYYHGTNLDSWEIIQREGVLFGRVDNNVSRCTYLTPDFKEAMCYGEVIPEVDYDPSKNPKGNNYCPGCWQFRVYEPIPLKDVKRIYMNKFTKETIDQYLSAYSKIWSRCREIIEYYYEAGLWIRGIHYMSDFEIYDGVITIIEQSHGEDLEFKMEDFIDDTRLEEAIKKDIEDEV